MNQPVDTTLFCLHFLGGSKRSWSPVAALLPPDIACVPIDLPGFGDAAEQPGATVADMAAAVTAMIAQALPALPSARWAIAGHSMGAKVALAVAGMVTPQAVVLLAGSPPGPEPMDEARREAMLTWFRGDAAICRDQAAAFIDGNTARPLPPAGHAIAVDDVLRMNPAAWRAWLEAGSREDWRDRIGQLDIPALILSGDVDADLGPDAQRRLMAPHFTHPRLVTLPDCRHLLPLEHASRVAGLIRDHLQPKRS